MKYKEKDRMWIRSQNKEKLVKCSAFSIARNFGGKKKYAVMGSLTNGFWGRTEIILGLYATKEVALNEITRLQSVLVTHTEVFEMS